MCAWAIEIQASAHIHPFLSPACSHLRASACSPTRQTTTFSPIVCFTFNFPFPSSSLVLSSFPFPFPLPLCTNNQPTYQPTNRPLRPVPPPWSLAYVFAQPRSLALLPLPPHPHPLTRQLSSPVAHSPSRPPPMLSSPTHHQPTPLSTPPSIFSEEIPSSTPSLFLTAPSRTRLWPSIPPSRSAASTLMLA